MHGYSPENFKSFSIQQPTEETISMCIVPVRISHQDNEQKEVEVYALLDENCQGIFVREDLCKHLPVTKRLTRITTETINGPKTDSSFAIEGLVVKPLQAFEKQYGSVRIQQIQQIFI